MYEEYRELGKRIAALDLGHYLEFGCGDGTFLAYLLNQNTSFQSVTAVDIHPKSVEAAKAKLGEYKVHFIIQEILPLELKEHRFSTITLSNTLHHLRDKAAVLAEFRRLLEPQGQIIVTEMISNDLSQAEQTYCQFHSLRAEIDRSNQTYHDTTYTSHEIENIISAAGLRIVSKSIILNEKAGPADAAEIQAVSTALDEMIVGEYMKPEYVGLKQKVHLVKTALQKHGIKRPRQLYLEIRP